MPETHRQQRHGSRSHGFNGIAQLSLVEHALSPLSYDTRNEGFVHRVSYPVYARGKRPVTANVTVSCPLGLAPSDELLLWGLLSLTLSDDKPASVFYATRHYVLSQLGLPVNGSYYAIFDAACRRMEFTTYENTAFYDPVRGELCDIRFGFFKRRKPTGADSERGDRFVWDQQFLEFAKHAYGRMRFPFSQYQRYSPGARRLFLLLRKFFHRRSVTPEFDVFDLAVNKLGLSPQTRIPDLKKAINRYAEELLEDGVLALPSGVATIRDGYAKRGKGEYAIQFHRGPNAMGEESPATAGNGSALASLLRDLDVSPSGIRWTLSTIEGDTIREWIDITLAAKERGLIKTTPAAFFIDNVKQVAKGSRQPPDWWRVIRKQEEEAEWEEAGQVLRSHMRAHAETQEDRPSFDDYMQTEAARNTFDRVCRDLFGICAQTSMGDSERETFVRRQGLQRMKSLYNEEYPRSVNDGPQSLFDILRET